MMMLKTLKVSSSSLSLPLQLHAGKFYYYDMSPAVVGNLLQHWFYCESLSHSWPDSFLFRRPITSPDLNPVAQRHNETGRFQQFVLKESNCNLDGVSGLRLLPLFCSIMLTCVGMWKRSSQCFLLTLQSRIVEETHFCHSLSLLQ